MISMILVLKKNDFSEFCRSPFSFLLQEASLHAQNDMDANNTFDSVISPSRLPSPWGVFLSAFDDFHFLTFDFHGIRI